MDRARLHELMERVGLDRRAVDVKELSAASASSTLLPSSSAPRSSSSSPSFPKGDGKGKRARAYIESRGQGPEYLGRARLPKPGTSRTASDQAIRDAIARIDAELRESSRSRSRRKREASALFDDDDDDSSLSTISTSSSRAPSGKYSKLLDQYAQCQKDKEVATLELRREKDKHRAAMDTLASKSKARERSLVAENEELSSELSSLRLQLSSAKKAFDGSFTISPMLYDALRRKSAARMSIKEHVQLRFYDETEAYRSAERSLRQKVEDQSEKLAAARARVRELEATSGSSDRVLERKTAGLERELAHATREIETLKKNLSSARIQGEKFREQASRYSDVRARLEGSERELAASLRRCDAMSAAAADAAKAAAAREDDNKAAMQQADILRVDKAYLSKELGAAQGRLKDLESKVERQREKIKAAERARDQARSDHLHKSDRGREGYEKRLQRDLEEFKLQQQKHLADIKVAHRESMEREVTSMREQRDLARADAEKLERTNQELASRLDDVRMEGMKRQAERAETEAELRGKLKMKTFELETAAAAHEERIKLAEDREEENEKLRLKLSALTSDFQKLELSKGKREAELRSMLDTERSRLRTYETLELELDAAIVARPEDTQEQNLNEDLLKMVPTLARRRVQQSVALAQRIVQLERELDLAKCEIARLQRENDGLHVSLSKANETLGGLTQPQSYVVDALKSREREIETMRVELNRLRIDCARYQEDYNRAVSEREAIRGDLRDIVAHRRELMQSFEATMPKCAPEIAVEEKTPALTRDPDDSDPGVLAPIDGDAKDVHELERLAGTGSNRAADLAASPTFEVHAHDPEGIPLPKWYRRGRIDDIVT